MEFNLSKKALGISPSATLEISAKARALKEAGVDVIDFGIGEPDFSTPSNIKAAALEALEVDCTKYTPASGLLALKKAICDKLLRDNKLTYKTEEIIVTSGAKHGLYNSLFALINPGDEVIVVSPYWVTYPQLVEIAGGKVVIISDVDEKSLNSALSDKTKAIIINSPNNPSGKVLDKDQLTVIAEFAVKNDVIVISDEIYEKLVYDGNEHISIASLNDEIKRLTLVVNGMSKSYSMTGFRLGYVAGDSEIIKVISNFQSQSVSHPSSISQYASIEGLMGDQSSVEIMRSKFEERRNLIVDLINDIDGLSVVNPEGAFYVFVNIEEIIGKRFRGKLIANSVDFCNLLLDEVGVVSVPGNGFGADDYIRLSFATASDNIVEGLRRVKELLN